MMRMLLMVILSLSGMMAHATPITPENMIGRYKVEASYLFQRAYMRINVINERDFEITRYYPDGHEDPTCQGVHVVNQNIYMTEAFELAAGNVFKGEFTCPDDRSKKYDFNIDYKSAQYEDLIKGANVTVKTSIAPGITLKAFVIRY